MKRLIALLCTLCMIATMAPFSVFAENGDSGLNVQTMWDGSTLIGESDTGFVATATLDSQTIICDEAVGGNDGSYMSFQTVTDNTAEALIYSTDIPTAPYVALSINVYGIALQHIYTRYDNGDAKPWIAKDINKKLAADRWNNVFVVYNNAEKTTDLYVNGEYVSSQNFIEYMKSFDGVTVSEDNTTWTHTYTKNEKESTESGEFNMNDARFKFIRSNNEAYNWLIDDLAVITSDSEIAPASYADITVDGGSYINGSVIKLGAETAQLSANGGKLMVNGAEGTEIKAGDEVVVVTSTQYGNLYDVYSAEAMAEATVSIYDGSALKKEFYLDASNSQLADLDDRWRIANINEGITAGVTDALGGKSGDGYLKFSGFQELSLTAQNKYDTRYFALSINVYGQNLRDIWTRLGSGSNKVSLVAEGYKIGGHLTNALSEDVWNNVFLTFDSQTKTSKTYINGKYFKSANLYTTVEKALAGTVDKEAGTAVANGTDINADYMNLRNDIRFLFKADTEISIDDIALVYADYEPAPVPKADLAVTGAVVSEDTIFMDEGAETAAISCENSVVLVDSGEGYAEATEIKAGDKVVVINNTSYGTVYDSYTVETPVYGTYEAFEKPDVKWSYANGILTIYGKGEMPAIADTTYTTRPWQDYVSSITKIVVEDGITKIAAKSFMLVSNLTEVEISGTVTTVGSYAFQGCSKLDNVVFPEGVTTVEAHVFHSANNVKTITLPYTFNSGATVVFNSKANTITTINVPWYAAKAIAWAENYKATKNADAVINLTGNNEGYFSDSEGVENAFRWELVPETGVITISKTEVESNGQLQTFTDHLPGKAVELIAPWHYQGKAGVISEIIVGEGITHVPGQLLRENSSYAKVTFPSTLKSAGAYTFNAAKISELYIKEGADFAGSCSVNDNCDIKKIIFPSTMPPARDFIRDFTFGTRGKFPKNGYAFEFIAPYGSPAYNWAQARYAEAVAQAQEVTETKDAEGNVTDVKYTDYCGISADKITIKASYDITANADGVVTVANNTGYAADSVYVIVAYYDDAECTKLSALRISDAQTLAEASNAVNAGAYDGAEGKTVKVFLTNGMLQLKPIAAVYGE